MEPYPDPYGPQLIQRCVIVQKDERGYGLTVTGDNPVYIQSVKDDGAAYRAGVQKGDRIIKVNGTLVTNCNHLEVVKLIRSTSYAALTLLGRPPGMKHQTGLSPPYKSKSDPTGKPTVTEPGPVTPEKDAELRNERFQTLKGMMEQETVLLKKMQAEYDVNPTEKLHRELTGIRTRIKVVEGQLTRTASMQPKVASTDVRDGSSPGEQEYENKNRNSPQHNHKEKRKSNESRSWLPHGVSHSRQRSSPDTFGVTTENPPGINLKRNNSDAQSKAETSRKKHVRGVGGAEAEIRRKRSDNIDHLGRSHSLPAEPGGADIDMADSSPNSTPPSSRRMDMETSHEDSTVTTKSRRDGAVHPPNHRAIKQATLGTVESFSQAVASDVPSVQSIPAPQVQIMSMEDDDFQSDNETPHGNISQNFEDHGPFIKLEQLEKKPAHMSIFLHYLISNSDPSSLFFYLVTDNYRTGSLKDMKKWVYEIFSTFLAPSAPLRIQVTDNIVQSIENTMSTQLQNEEAMRSVFLTARHNATAEIRELLADFRAKRALGLGSIFGDQQLHNEDMDRMQELKIVEQTLMPHLDRLTTLEAEREDKNVAMAFAITTFMKQVGVRVTGNSPLERCPSFTARDKRPKWAKSKKQHIKGHQFVEMHYQSTAFCNHCNGLLWGIGYQGYQCQNCEFNIHKSGLCLDQLEELCQGREGKKDKKWRRMIPGSQRPKSDRISQILPPGDKKDDSDKATSPGAISPTPIAVQVRPGLGEDDEITQLKEKVNVDNLVKQFEVKTDDPNQLVSSHSSLKADSGISESYDRLHEANEVETTTSKRSLLRSASLKTKGEEKRDKRPHQGDRISRRSDDRSSSQSIDDVDQDKQSVVMALTNASSSSSLSTRSQDSPSASIDSLSHQAIEEDIGEDSDMEAEAEPSNWQDLVDKDIVKRLKPKEVKRQEVINELFHTEKSHIRNLKVLDRVFYRAMLREQVLSKELIHAVFPNLNETLELHCPLNNIMKKERKTSHLVQEVAYFLLKTFDGEAGETAKRVCASFCQNQKAALEMLKNRQKKDSRLAQFITDAEANTLCRRLPLQALISTEMQRLTKYPLLIENLLKYTQPKLKEYEALGKCLQCTKKLLAHVNQAVKDCENHQRLLDIVRHLDKGPFERSNHPIAAEYKNLDLKSRKLLHDGTLIWKLSKTKTLDVYALLFADILVVLQKQDDRYVMKCHSTTVPMQLEEKKNTHSPIIKINSVLCREVATNKRAFFLVSTSTAGPQIYELTTISTAERQGWMDMILKTQDEAKKASKRGETPTTNNTSLTFNFIEEEEDTNTQPITGSVSGKHTSVEINNPPQVSQPEVVMQSTIVTEETRHDSPQELLSALAKELQEDTSTEARASKKTQAMVALSEHLSILLKANYEKRDAKREELIEKAIIKIHKLSESLQGDVTRIETDLQQATEERSRIQQALMEQSQSQTEEQQRKLDQEPIYTRTKKGVSGRENDEITARKKTNRISSSGGSTTDSDECVPVESSEAEDSFTPKERPSSLVMDSEEGIVVIGKGFHQAETQEAIAVINDGLMNLQRAQVRKVTDVDSVEIDDIMENLEIKTASVNNVQNRTEYGETSRSTTKQRNVAVKMTESVQDLSVADDNWRTPPEDLHCLEEETSVVIATRLDDLLNEDSESDPETVVATERLENDVVSNTNQSEAFTMSHDSHAIPNGSKSLNNEISWIGDDPSHQTVESCQHDSTQDSLEMNDANSHDTSVVSGAAMLDVPSHDADSRPASLVSVDSLTVDVEAGSDIVQTADSSNLVAETSTSGQAEEEKTGAQEEQEMGQVDETSGDNTGELVDETGGNQGLQVDEITGGGAGELEGQRVDEIDGYTGELERQGVDQTTGGNNEQQEDGTSGNAGELKGERVNGTTGDKDGQQVDETTGVNIADHDDDPEDGEQDLDYDDSISDDDIHDYETIK